MGIGQPRARAVAGPPSRLAGMNQTPDAADPAESNDQTPPVPAAIDLAPPAPGRFLTWLLLVGGIIGFLAAFDLTVERIRLIADPDYIPTCNISPILSCGSVMLQEQATVFGFSNSLIGVAGFASIITVAMAIFAGAKFKAWYWIGIQVGVSFGIVFVHWLMYQSLYVIGSLCPYCMVVWAVTIPMFVYVTLYNLTSGNFGAPAARSNFWKLIRRNAWAIVLIWYAIIAALIIVRFPNLF